MMLTELHNRVPKKHKRDARYLLAFTLHPADALKDKVLYVGGYAANDAHPTRSDAIYTWIVPLSKARLLTAQEVEMIRARKLGLWGYAVVIPQPETPLLPARVPVAVEMPIKMETERMAA